MEIDESFQTVYWMNFNVHVCKCIQKYFNLNSALCSKCCLIITLVWYQNMKKICYVRLGCMLDAGCILTLQLGRNLSGAVDSASLENTCSKWLLHNYTHEENTINEYFLSFTSLFTYLTHLTTFTLVLCVL